MQRAHVERVEAPYRRQPCLGLRRTAQPAEHEHSQVMGLEEPRLGGQRRVEVLQRGRPSPLAAVQACQGPVRGRSPRGVPRGLGQGVVRLAVPLQAYEGQAEPVERLAVAGVGVAQGPAGHGAAQQILRRGVLTVAVAARGERDGAP